MTNNERYIVNANIAHYQAMLKLDIDAEKRSAIDRLLGEAEEALAAGLKERSSANSFLSSWTERPTNSQWKARWATIGRGTAA